MYWHQYCYWVLVLAGTDNIEYWVLGSLLCIVLTLVFLYIILCTFTVCKNNYDLELRSTQPPTLSGTGNEE